ncbi:hypothetical protein CHUAL_013123 [Chamberlinius hualienensis]
MAHGGGKVLIGEGSESDDDDVLVVSSQEGSNSKWTTTLQKNSSISVTVPNKRTVDLAATVILGEASESDEEEEIVTDNRPYKVETTVLSLPTLMKESSTPTHDKKIKFQYNSYVYVFHFYTNVISKSFFQLFSRLLHKKLREKNAVLGKKIAAVARQPYSSMMKEINSVTHLLVKSQSEIQEVGPILRQINTSLTLLDEKLDITNDFTRSIPLIKIESSSTPNAVAK